MIAALFVATNGPYFNLRGIEPYDERRDAKKYRGPWPVIAHPPCERWGRYWFGGPSVNVRKELGADGGCFESALNAVNNHGGVLEHPDGTHAWKKFNILRPTKGIGWELDGGTGGWVCRVEQGNYGHPARKATWLYFVGNRHPMNLIWTDAPAGIRLDEGFHSKEERDRCRAAGQKPIQRLTKAQRVYTPLPFRDKLIELVTKGCA